MIALLAAAALPPADVIYTDGVILPMTDAKEPPEALAVRNGRIAAAGKKADVMKFRGPATRVVSLGRRALLPGFVDPHSHFLAAAVAADWANVSLPPVGPVKSIPDILAVLRKQAARQKAKPGDWIVAYGYDSIGLAEKRDVNRRDLDVIDVIALPEIHSTPRMAGKPEFAFGVNVDHVKIGGLKAIVDGSPQGGSGYYTKPYLVPGPEGQSPWRGQPSVTPEELSTALRTARAGGGQLFTHANGDASIDMVIQAQKDVGLTAKDDARTVVVHSQFARPDQLDAYVTLGMVPSFFTNHTFYWGDDYPALVGVERGQGISPAASALARGIRFTNHTDFLVTPLDSMFTVWSAVNRTSKSGKVIGPGERGTLEVGKVADLVLLSANPPQVDPQRLREVKVLETVKGGKTVFTRTAK